MTERSNGKPKIRGVKADPLRDPWAELRKKPGVTILSEASTIGR